MRLALPRRMDREAYVEVVVPCHNYGRYLPGCVASVVRQPGVRTSVTIVDDASTDDSADVAERLSSVHTNVRLIRNEQNLGAVRTFNVGLSQADSDYVVLLSADDLLAPGALVRAVTLMAVRSEVGMVYGHAKKFVGHPVARPPLPAVTWTTWRGEEWLELQLRRAWNVISSPEVVVRTRVQHAVGYYDPGLPLTHDVEMWLRIAAVTGVGHVNGVDQAYYRRHITSLSSSFATYRDIEERWRAYDQFLSGWQRRSDAERLRPVVQRRLADEVLRTLLDDLERGEPAADDVTAALAVAERIDPSVTERAAWRDATGLREGSPHPGAGTRVRALRRDALARVRWRRWSHWRYLG